MNQLEHLKALRDKARVQTEQAKAVLKQQGEISESLDKLIAALEGNEDIDANLANDSISEAKGAAIAAVGGNLTDDGSVSGDSEDSSGSLGELIAKVDEQKSQDETSEINPALIAGTAGAAAAIGAAAISLGSDADENEGTELQAGDSSENDDIVWVEEDRPEIPETKKEVAQKAPPKLEPIVWEVSEEKASGNADSEDVAEVSSSSDDSEEDGNGLGIAAAAAGIGAAAVAGAAALSGDDSEEEGDLKFKFLKFGEDNEEAATEVADSSEEMAPVVPPLGVADAEDADADASSEDDSTEQVEIVEEIAAVEESSGPVVPPLAIPTPEVTSEETDASEEVVEEAASSAVVPPPIPTPVVPSIDQAVEETKEVAEATSDQVGDSIEEAVTSLNERVSETDDTIAISPALAASAAALGAGAVAVSLNDNGPEKSEKPSLPPIPTPAAVAPVVTEEVTTVSSNIFFDANSAYLKDSELTKVQSIAEAIAGGEGRLVKIQGLEDLASSNDFKVLLASRRLLAVKKKLAEKGIAVEKLSIHEIQLSEEGRVLEPPSIEISPS